MLNYITAIKLTKPLSRWEFQFRQSVHGLKKVCCDADPEALFDTWRRFARLREKDTQRCVNCLSRLISYYVLGVASLESRLGTWLIISPEMQQQVVSWGYVPFAKAPAIALSKKQIYPKWPRYSTSFVSSMEKPKGYN